jgi:hypothetical protein
MRPGGLAIKRSSASAIALLPQPLSPTSARISPANRSNETSSTAVIKPASVRKSTVRLRTRSTCPYLAGGGGRVLLVGRVRRPAAHQDLLRILPAQFLCEPYCGRLVNITRPVEAFVLRLEPGVTDRPRPHQRRQILLLASAERRTRTSSPHRRAISCPLRPGGGLARGSAPRAGGVMRAPRREADCHEATARQSEQGESQLPTSARTGRVSGMCCRSSLDTRWAAMISRLSRRNAGGRFRHSAERNTQSRRPSDRIKARDVTVIARMRISWGVSA